MAFTLDRNISLQCGPPTEYKKFLGFGNYEIVGFVNPFGNFKYSCDGSIWYDWGEFVGVDSSSFLQFHEEKLRIFNSELWIGWDSANVNGSIVDNDIFIHNIKIKQLPEDTFLYPDLKEIINKENRN